LQAIGGKIFEEAKRQRKCRNGSGRGGAKAVLYLGSIAPDRIERSGNHRAAAAGSGARDEVDQLPPAHRSVMAVAGRLVEDGQ
jgi:hypothetical protein